MIWLLLALPIVGSFLLIRGKLRTLDTLKNRAEHNARRPLEAIAGDVGGRIVPGPALETPSGKLMLYASKAPKDAAIDVTKFTAAVPGDHSLIIVRAEDARKVPTKGLHPVALTDPGDADRYRVFASVPEFGQRVFSPAFGQKFRSFESTVKSRARLQLIHGTATLTLSRGLTEADELRDFYKASITIMDDLKSQAAS